MSRATVKKSSTDWRRGPNASKIRKLLAAALKQRMELLSLGELEVANACGYQERDAVSRWRAGTSWPYPATEEKLEQAIKVSQGFFARLADGMTYEDALKNSAQPEPLSTADMLREKFNEYMKEQEQRAEGEEVNRILANSIDLAIVDMKRRPMVSAPTDKSDTKRPERDIVDADKKGQNDK